MQVPIEHKGTLAQAMPVSSQPLRSVLHVCGCAPLQRMSPAAQAGALQVPPMHKAVEAHAVPLLTQPVWSVLQACGWAPLQRRSVGAHAGELHVPVAALQSAVVTHAVPMFIQLV